MKKNIMDSIQKGLKTVGKFADKHSPEILVGCGIAGFIGTIILVAKEAPVAKERLEDLHEELAERDEEELSKSKIIFEEVKTVAPVYAPAVVTGAVSVACVLGSYRISSGRTAALATAYEITQASFQEYKDKVKAEIGEKKEKVIEDKIAQDHVDKNPPPSNAILNGELGDGKQWFYEPCTNQYFRSTVDQIRKAEITVQHWLDTGYEDFVSVNEFLWELDPSGVNRSTPIGDDWGWYADRGGINVVFSSVVAPGPLSALVLDYDYYSRCSADHIYQ